MKAKNRIIFMIISVLTTFSCKKFIEIDAPRNSVVLETAFKNNDMATATVAGIYQQMGSGSRYSSGGSSSIATVCGTSSDEFIGYSNSLKQVYEHQLTPQLSDLTNSAWTNIYATIYDVNSILEGLDKPNGLTLPVKAQLKGEALFLRAFHYFYLVNLFGSIPLHLSTDYQANGKAIKTPINEVYSQIIQDLKAAEILLNDTYPTSGRVRPNKVTIQALLARTYFYLGDWQNAEKYATLIIERSSTYKLLPLADIFLSNSLETIWQLMPPTSSNTSAGNILILTPSVAPVFVSLRPDFVQNTFEINDRRKTAWIQSIVANAVTYYYPFKYKIKSSTNVTEYYTVFRLAEQFLIRSEARAHQNNFLKAIEDVDEIRYRAGLSSIKNQIPIISKENLLVAIQKERRVEFFSEWGDRWLDLKRINKSTVVLSQIKANWRAEYIYYPIPKDETDRNQNIIQNDGY